MPPLVSWAVSASTLARETKAHRADLTAVATLCGVRIPGPVQRFRRTGKRDDSRPLNRIWLDTPEETESKARCKRCEAAAVRRSGTVTTARTAR